MCATGASTDKKGNINVKNKDIVNAEDYLDNLTRNSQNNFSKDVDHNNDIENNNLTSFDAGIQNFESLDIIDVDCSEKQIACTCKRNKLVQAMIIAKIDDFQKLPDEILKKVKLSMGDLKVDRKKLYIKSRLYISNNNELTICVL